MTYPSMALDRALDSGEDQADDGKVFGVSHRGILHVFEDIPRGLLGRVTHVRVEGSSEQTHSRSEGSSGYKTQTGLEDARLEEAFNPQLRSRTGEHTE